MVLPKLDDFKQCLGVLVGLWLLSYEFPAAAGCGRFAAHVANRVHPRTITVERGERGPSAESAVLESTGAPARPGTRAARRSARYRALPYGCTSRLPGSVRAISGRLLCRPLDAGSRPRSAFVRAPLRGIAAARAAASSVEIVSWS